MSGMPFCASRSSVAAMDPQLDMKHWRFVLIEPSLAPQLLGAAIGTFRENEGVTAIVPVEIADECGLEGSDFSRITLNVFSDLEETGLTAAVSGALAEARIACNIVAAFHHDHVFVPAGSAERALEILQALQAAASRR